MKKQSKFSNLKKAFTSFVSDYTRFQIVIVFIVVVLVFIVGIAKKLFF